MRVSSAPARVAPVPARPDARPPRGGRRRRARTGALVGTASLALALAVAERLELPGLSYSLMIGTWGPDWLALLALLTLLAALAVRRRSSPWRVLAALALVAATALTAWMGWDQVAFAREHGVELDAVALTGLEQPGRAPDLQPVVLNDTVTGQLLRAGVWLPRDPATGRIRTPEEARAARQGGSAVVVLLHGGGWRTGNRLNPMTRGQAAWLADQGYLAIALDYPLSTPRLATWDLAESRSACGLAWVGEHARQYGGDASRIALVGDSAGGNLALELAYRQVLGTVESACGGTVPTIAALSVTYPIVDPVGFHDNPDPIMGPFVRERAERYTGGTPEEVHARYEAVDPRVKVSEAAARGLAASLPPTLLAAGERDHVVPVAGTESLDRLLTEAGAPHRTVLMPLTDHVFDLNPGSAASQTWRALTLRLLEEEGLGASGPVS